MIGTLTVSDRITRAKIQLQRQSPFFAHLVMNLKITESKEIPTMAVDCKGHLIYNEEFVGTLTDEEIKGVLAHETMHVALLHLTRLGKKEMMIWNVATDICINNMIVAEGFHLPKGGLIPQYNEIKLPIEGGEVVVKDINKKTANEVYEQLMKDLPEKDAEDLSGFDEHQYGDDMNMTEEERDALEKEWKGKLVDAATAAKARGKLPGGMERMIDELLNPKLNWKALLYQFITRDIVYNYTMAKPGRRSYGSGVYMPTTLKENLNIAVTIDTSGSISNEEYQDFISEVSGIASAFGQVNMELVFWDTKVRATHKITSSNKKELLEIKPAGGGGTEIGCLYDYYQGKQAPQLMVHLTDGYVERYPKMPMSKHLFCLTSKYGTDQYVKNLGVTVSL
tara:strand:+ start:3374 stop:4555 length:1182 start_codon:yes stop_codon:yes gene_type:complete